jgi:hypothetical protein
VKERQRKRDEGDREIKLQRDRETERQRGRETERQRERETERQRHCVCVCERERESVNCSHGTKVRQFQSLNYSSLKQCSEYTFKILK